ncbi:hypothetical protein GCM10010970_24480 [Silvimonas iriomotensis]|uniref:Uncharacterized protein n=2 Tax=Silvimonas TaxID=300264 RepID=A0ABQ2PAV3_9NEIS|nr:hypothetical protein GCM10010970_24480 [Silvimonas iriomotensis]GGP27055.1 hypothetical protein GCM10010971_28740 [Silvimonas amylolytica]
MHETDPGRDTEICNPCRTQIHADKEGLKAQTRMHNAFEVHTPDRFNHAECKYKPLCQPKRCDLNAGKQVTPWITQ